MTLEELCAASPEVLEKLSDIELTKFLEPYFNVTRPELAAKQPRKNEPSTQFQLFIPDSKKNALIASGLYDDYVAGMRKKNRK